MGGAATIPMPMTRENIHVGIGIRACLESMPV